ncbi:MAG: hypothetical protein KUL83_10525 [Lentimicrobium sp.]|jgi:hypothetical protein|nr:hypothetical protein [Lentimicrobium sp.]MDD2527625.1 hypothetical protein [Lentimicrobiaceae bacterium]MDD4597948.1 hypothetical protein [Lentimicrobiaceae bacterium]MDY0024534.1 hypothetical protein [Lentimicrobium sp.]
MAVNQLYKPALMVAVSLVLFQSDEILKNNLKNICPFEFHFVILRNKELKANSDGTKG